MWLLYFVYFLSQNNLSYISILSMLLTFFNYSKLKQIDRQKNNLKYYMYLFLTL